MKLKLFFLTSLIVIPITAKCCGWCWTDPESRDFYRIMPYRTQLTKGSDFVSNNCLLWQQQTSTAINTDKIRSAIYSLSAKNWKEIMAGRNNFDNPFATYLIEHHDSTAIGLLYYSKCFEEVRSIMRDPWYYSSDNDQEHQELRKIAQWAMSQNSSGKYHNRILLLKAKSLSALNRHQELMELWKNESPTLPHDCIWEVIEGYAARAILHMGDTAEAVKIYTRQGDIQSLELITPNIYGIVSLMLQSDPNNEHIKPLLQRMLVNARYLMGTFRMEDGITLAKSDIDSMISLCREARNRYNAKDKGMWCYVESALHLIQDHPDEAMRTIENAPSSKDQFIARSIRLLQLYLHVRLDPIDEAYCQHLLHEIQWLDGQLATAVRYPDPSDRYFLEGDSLEYWERGYGNMSTIYINDALRHILLSSHGACKRMVEAGWEVRALQLANLACNRLPQLSNSTLRMSRNWRKDPRFVDDVDIYWNNYFNNFDFSNDMFCMADTLSWRALKEFYERQQHPRDPFDRFMATRGQHDHDYWLDIMGTHALREMNYTEASQYFSKMSPNYTYNLNTYRFMGRDPFKNNAETIWIGAINKISFANRMCQLEKAIRQTDSPDNRADSMLVFSIGLRNSMNGKCWYLTGYKDYDYYDQEDDPEEFLYAKGSGFLHQQHRALNRQHELQCQALALYTDPERKAEGYAQLNMLVSIIKELPFTLKGQYIAAHCDRWKDWITQ